MCASSSTGSSIRPIFRAGQVEILQRELVLCGNASLTSEYLVRRTRLVPQELEKDYELLRAAYASPHGEGGEMPLRRLRLKTLITPERVRAPPDMPFPNTGQFRPGPVSV